MSMRDIFADIFAEEAAHPMEAARRAMRPRLRKRFYARSQVGEVGAGFGVLLDDKPVRTPARHTLAAPVRALAQAFADEWEAQREVIDPAAMPLTRLANSIIDGVADSTQVVAAEIGKYLAGDLILYRAEGPEGLRARQAKHWDPLLEWARETFGAHFVLTEGVAHVVQPDAAIAAIVKVLPSDAWRLGALHSVTTLTGSALIAMALLHGRLSADEAWAAAHVDEDWQMEKWGRDTLVLERRAFHRADFDAAVKVIELLKLR
jgi:chaperone required for assembly of F1-ATPase